MVRRISSISNMDVSKNRGIPKWMVYKSIMENPIRMDDLGGKPPIFGNTLISPFIPPPRDHPFSNPPAERMDADRMSRSLRRFISSNFTDGQRNLDDVGSRENPGGRLGAVFDPKKKKKHQGLKKGGSTKVILFSFGRSISVVSNIFWMFTWKSGKDSAFWLIFFKLGWQQKTTADRTSATFLSLVEKSGQ